MAVSLPLPAFSAFESQLKTLCLKEFPCGSGPWKEDYSRKKQSLKKLQLESKYSITVKDYGALHEKTETLEELVTSKTSPWNLDYSWSDEAKTLREIAVRSPWLIDDRFVQNHFRTIRIVDKGVTDVDGNFLKFENLEELTLSANYLRTVNSRHLPQKLKVLELCANQISHLADLCICPPPLIHLGLGYNRLHMIEDYITGDYWPQLLSLDLSHNNLSDLMDIVRKLQSLPKLRNLTLQGNPLCLVPAYRGYTIDSIRRLDFLDEISISADEKHHFKGLAKRKEFILDEAKFVFKVDFLRGVPMPEEMKNPEEQPEFPVVTRKYFLRFIFLKDRSSTNDLFHSMMQQSDKQSVGTQPSEVTTGRQSELTGTERSSKLLSHVTGSQRNVAFAAAVETVREVTETEIVKSGRPVKDTDSIAGGDHEPMDTSEQKVTEDLVNQSEGCGESPKQGTLELVSINSSRCEWSEEMEVDWGEVVVRDDLLALRDFLKTGVDVHVMEEKVLSYPAEPEGNTSPNTEGKSPTKKEEKKKEAKPKDDKKKKKKGEPDVEMTSLPPEYTAITSFHIPTEDFIHGDCLFENLFRKNNEGDNGFVTPASFYEVKKEDKKEKKKDGGKKEKGGKKSPVPNKKEKGGKDKKAAIAADTGDDEFVPPPPPLETSLSIELIQWKTAQDSLKTDYLGKDGGSEAGLA